MGEFKLIIKPDEEEPEAAEVYVDGRLGGHAYRFLLDTGAARTSVVYDDYTSTFECMAKSDVSWAVFASSRDDLIQVPSLDVGPISKQNLIIVRNPQTDLRVISLIGMDLLKDLCCHFLFDADRVLVDEDERSGDYAWQTLLLDKTFHPYVEVQFGAVKANTVWDTGASITVVDMNFVEKYRDLFEAAGHSTGTDATGTSVETPTFVMAASKIGGHTFPPHRVVGVDLSPVNATLEVPMDLILGYSTLRKANWLFDFPQARWAITKQLSG